MPTSNKYSGCSSLTSVIIPNSVTKIGYSIFSNCENLKSLKVYPRHYTSLKNSYGSIVELIGAPIYTVTLKGKTQTSLTFALKESTYNDAPEGYDNLTVTETGYSWGIYGPDSVWNRKDDIKITIAVR